MRIEVTEEDIRNGEQENSRLCPVALACLRVVNKNWALVWIKLSQNNRWDIIEKVMIFIKAFDKKLSVEPFSFELPDELFKEEVKNAN